MAPTVGRSRLGEERRRAFERGGQALRPFGFAGAPWIARRWLGGLVQRAEEGARLGGAIPLVQLQADAHVRGALPAARFASVPPTPNATPPARALPVRIENLACRSSSPIARTSATSARGNQQANLRVGHPERPEPRQAGSKLVAEAPRSHYRVDLLDRGHGPVREDRRAVSLEARS